MQPGLWARLIPFATPEIVPPVPALATKTSTFPDDGWTVVEGVDVTAVMISGAVVSSCASGLFTCVQNMESSVRTYKENIHCDIDPGLCHLVSLSASAAPRLWPQQFSSIRLEGPRFKVLYLYDFLGHPRQLHLESAQLQRRERAMPLLSPMTQP